MPKLNQLAPEQQPTELLDTPRGVSLMDKARILGKVVGITQIDQQPITLEIEKVDLEEDEFSKNIREKSPQTD